MKEVWNKYLANLQTYLGEGIYNSYYKAIHYDTLDKKNEEEEGDSVNAGEYDFGSEILLETEDGFVGSSQSPLEI